MEKPTTILSAEHQNILKVIQVLLKECDLLEKNKEINSDFFRQVIDFIRGYADKFHHAKEEEILFKEMNKDTVSLHCNPIEQMLHEHDLGRNFVKSIDDGVRENNQNKILAGARGYAYLLQDHIFKEDNILYPMADEALDQKTQELILAKFEKINEDDFGSKIINKYLDIVQKLSNV